MKQVIFGVGTGRCGTMTLAIQFSLLGSHEWVGVHEGRIIGKRGSGLGHLICGDSLTRANREYNKFVIQRRVDLLTHSGFNYLEAAHYMSYNLDLVAEAWPQAKLIWLWRMPIDTVRSFMLATSPSHYKNGRHHRSTGAWKSWGGLSAPLAGMPGTSRRLCQALASRARSHRGVRASKAQGEC